MEDMDVDAGAGREMVVEMEDEPPHASGAKFKRRASMSEEEERQRRASIKAILADRTIPEVERRRSIQHLMDGRRSSFSNGSITPPPPPPPVPTSYEADSAAGHAGLRHPPQQITPQPIPTADLIMTHNGPTCQIVPHSNEQTKRAELTRPLCSHYDRKCTLIAPCCGAAFGCRICHDDCPVLPPKITVQQVRRRYPRSSSLPSSWTDMGSTPEDTHHTIDRFAVQEVICRQCFTRQSSKANNCINCGVQFGAYHCDICNLWMSDEERPYHCPDCGFCRVGGAENFKHCHDCGMCIDRTLYDNHNCKVGKYKSNCPVCQEYLFSSRSASHEMPCGHAIHWDCFRQLAAHDSRCPICKKTAETRERMMPTWNAMAAGVALQPVPPELSRVVNITCNDCEQSDNGRAWHFLGVQCRECSSFNTVVDRIVLSGEDAHDYLEAVAQRQNFSAPFDASQSQSAGRPRVSRRRSHV